MELNEYREKVGEPTSSLLSWSLSLNKNKDISIKVPQFHTAGSVS
jgi:hypothetical protein